VVPALCLCAIGSIAFHKQLIKTRRAFSCGDANVDAAVTAGGGSRSLFGGLNISSAVRWVLQFLLLLAVPRPLIVFIAVGVCYVSEATQGGMARRGGTPTLVRFLKSGRLVGSFW